MSIGEKLKELREKAGYNKREAAEKFDMPYTTYNNYETDARDVGSETLRKIARFYGVTTDYILENEFLTEDQEDLLPFLEELRYRPEMRMLFSASKEASKDDIEKAVKIIEALKDHNESDE